MIGGGFLRGGDAPCVRMELGEGPCRQVFLEQGGPHGLDGHTLGHDRPIQRCDPWLDR